MSKKVALVTGASSGIGRASAIALAAQGAKVAVHYHSNLRGAEETAGCIRSQGGEAILTHGDAKDSAQVATIVDQTMRELGPVDILVNNAGSLVERLRILELTEERWDEVIDLNLKSAYLFSRAVIPAMVERRGGVIINVASIAGRNGGGLGSIHYSTAKGGLITFTKSLAKELAPLGILVNGVAPGVIETPFHEQFSTPEMMQAYARNIPLGRAGQPREVGEVVAFLASNAASYLVGETIEINGGLLMD